MLQTPLYAFHLQNGGRMVDFAGWEMPVMYTSIVEEHVHTRTHASIFDVSHMGRVEFHGSGAGAFLERLCTRRLGDAGPGVSRYSHVCRADGGILDDVIVSRLEDHWLMVCNASNRQKLLAWFDQQRTGFDVRIVDRTLETAMVAIQGPEALATLSQLLPVKLDDLKRYHFRTGALFGHDYYAARSGYTGEDGVEIILPARIAGVAAGMLVSRSAELARPIKPAGLGARDTLRLEAAMPLYGHELTEEWDSISAGQGWCVALDKDFIGREALARVKAEGPKRQIAGFEVNGRRIARHGAPVLPVGSMPETGGNVRPIGVVTSGTHSPTLDKVIGLAMIDSDAAGSGSAIRIDLKTTSVEARVVPTPFYKRKS